MTRNVVDLEGRTKNLPHPSLASDFWFAQLDVRLGRIEFMVARLEWQILLIACGAFGLLVLEIVQAVRGF
jgi:hypothetical protein